MRAEAFRSQFDEDRRVAFVTAQASERVRGAGADDQHDVAACGGGRKQRVRFVKRAARAGID